MRAGRPQPTEYGRSFHDHVITVGDAPISTSTTVAFSPSPARSGEELTVTITVTPSAGAGGQLPEGPATVTIDSTPHSVHIHRGTARIAIPVAAARDLTATADYDGNENFLPSSTTTPRRVTVQRATPPGIADTDLTRVFNPITGWPPTVQPTVEPSIALYQAAVLGDGMGINQAYTVLIKKFNESTLPRLSNRSFDIDLLNTISVEMNRTTPEPSLQYRRDLILQALGAAPDASDDQASSGSTRNNEFPKLWSRFRRVFLNAHAEATQNQHPISISRLLPIAQLIQVNLSQAMTPAMTLRTQGLTREVARRLITLSSQDVLATLGAETWQDAVVTLTRGTPGALTLSQILTAGQVMDAVTAGLRWIMNDRKESVDGLEALTDAMITLDALSDLSTDVPIAQPMAELASAHH